MKDSKKKNSGLLVGSDIADGIEQLEELWQILEEQLCLRAGHQSGDLIRTRLTICAGLAARLRFRTAAGNRHFGGVDSRMLGRGRWRRLKGSFISVLLLMMKSFVELTSELVRGDGALEEQLELLCCCCCWWRLTKNGLLPGLQRDASDWPSCRGRALAEGSLPAAPLCIERLIVGSHRGTPRADNWSRMYLESRKFG